MRIVYSHWGLERVFEQEDASQIIIGRPEGTRVDLDLSPDETVSPAHARLWVEDGQCWLEDMGSQLGTKVNGEEIKGAGKRAILRGDLITIGNTKLRAELTASEYSQAKKPQLKEIPKPLRENTPKLDASAPAFTPDHSESVDAARRLALFYELPLRFGEETRLDALLQLILESVIKAIPHAQRGALLVRDEAKGKLALKAHIPVGSPSVSLSTAQQAIEHRSAFIWPPPQQLPQGVMGTSVPNTNSVVTFRIKSAMYAPLLWRGKAMGVLCVDNSESGFNFNVEDLRLLQAVAHHAAMAVANLQLQEEWRTQAEVLNNTLRLVSPQLAGRLRQQRGRVRLGGDFREATILIADIRGFTNLSATMSPHEVTQMLEDYFGRLVPLVFENEGTVDKFIGDAIMAVFGSPDSDEQQHQHAVQCALGMQEAMLEVNAQRAARGLRTGELGVGIHCGEVVHGFIGTPERMEFTVIGDAVNRASRYCDGAGGGEVLISPDVYQWVWQSVRAEQSSISTKHEGLLFAYRIASMK
ncbi:MAG: FHA domain-containing protein [Pyrinomonadaceae bacterium]|nr:FHA domain-containing protein [Pyrinomonadaceae bacterium]